MSPGQAEIAFSSSVSPTTTPYTSNDGAADGRIIDLAAEPKRHSQCAAGIFHTISLPRIDRDKVENRQLYL